MGFRSTVTSQDYSVKWPKWFVEKYSVVLYFNKDADNPLCSIVEAKTYGLLDQLHTDVQKSLIEQAGPAWEDYDIPFVFVYLHECGGITRCEISKADIKWSEPDSWVRTKGVTHSYCDGCSSVPEKGAGNE